MEKADLRTSDGLGPGEPVNWIKLVQLRSCTLIQNSGHCYGSELEGEYCLAGLTIKHVLCQKSA